MHSYPHPFSSLSIALHHDPFLSVHFLSISALLGHPLVLFISGLIGCPLVLQSFLQSHCASSSSAPTKPTIPNIPHIPQLLGIHSRFGQSLPSLQMRVVAVLDVHFVSGLYLLQQSWKTLWAL